MRRLGIALASAALAVPAGAAAMDDMAPDAAAPSGMAVVTIPGRLFSPAHLVVLVGTTVTWRNDDGFVHDVEAPDGSISSGRLTPGASYSQTFTTPGTHPYLCVIHRSMRGTIDVVALGLDGPTEPLRPGAHAALDAQAVPGTEMQLERLPAQGPPEVVGDAVADARGHALFGVVADAPARYRLRAGDLTSGVVSVHVAPEVSVTAVRRGGVVRVRATVAPAQAGAAVELRNYVRERFDYLPLRAGRLGADSTATWTLKTGRRLRLRVQLAKPVGGFSEAVSRPFVVPRAVLS